MKLSRKPLNFITGQITATQLTAMAAGNIGTQGAFLSTPTLEQFKKAVGALKLPNSPWNDKEIKKMYDLCIKSGGYIQLTGSDTYNQFFKDMKIKPPFMLIQCLITQGMFCKIM